ncbi:Kinesin-like protein KIF18B [Pseudolycoriella hygida]|uniref:Kinesin-like protein KIF18B n=1 Tax=Pseudolycoriella hygida TaxID=35572 RepID=A0A9Q0RU67_9DIPT|nr:Kinesin-like protein KIF18B [Pseudolycoriella hygida]
MPKSESNNLQVILRMRPLLGKELKLNKRNVIEIIDQNTIIFDPIHNEFCSKEERFAGFARKDLRLSFDRVFGKEATNVDIFHYSLRPLISSVLKGYNCCVFVYGVTGAGKTYTMLGSDTKRGVVYLAMEELFRQIETQRSHQSIDVGISYVEVYNEQVINLLTKDGPLKLREDSNGVIIDGVIPQRIQNCDEMVTLLCIGNHNRSQHPTDANYKSSRSHAICQVHLASTNKASGLRRVVKLSMIDLAGSERGSSSSYEELRFKEGTSINKSLLALGNCIKKLAEGSKHIPYRDSNMTRILKDSLSGNCKTVMIANVSPAERSYSETYNTLLYATRATQIRKNALSKTELKTSFPKEYYVRNLVAKISETEELRDQIKILENQVKSQAKVIENFEKAQNGLVKLIKKIETLKHKIDKSYHDLVSSRQRK